MLTRMPGAKRSRHERLDERTASVFERRRRSIVPEAELERLLRLRVGALRVIDPEYPRLLREIPVPPPLIYVRGRLTPENDLAVGVVGMQRVSARSSAKVM